MKKEQKLERTRGITGREFVMGLMIVLFAISTIVSAIIINNMTAKNYLVPKNIGSTYVVGQYQKVILLDLNDPRQRTIAQAVEATCLQADIPRCQSAADRLNLR